MKLQDKKVIVLGGSGFIGNRLCEELLSRGAEVTNFDWSVPPTEQKCKYLHGNFFNEQEMLEAIRGHDCIVHAVCSINPGTSVTKYRQGYQLDFIQTMKLCDAAAQNKQRLLFLSSGGTVYGKHDKPVQEDDIKAPINHYGALKLCIEEMMQVFIHNGADFRIARTANAYGPGQDYRKGVGFIDAAIRGAIGNTPIEIWGDGNIVRDYIYVDDACQMLCEFLCSEKTPPVLNIGSGYGITQNEIVGFLEALEPDIKVIYSAGRTVDVPISILDISKFKAYFDFRPRLLEQGITHYYNWLKMREGDNSNEHRTH